MVGGEELSLGLGENLGIGTFKIMNIKMNLLEDWTEYLQQQINEAGYALNKNNKLGHHEFEPI